MIVIIKSTHSLSILITDRFNGWWATQWITIQSISILTDYPNDQYTIPTQSLQFFMIMNTDRFKREGFMMMKHSSDPRDQLSLHYHSQSLSQQNEVIWIIHLSLFHLYHWSIPYSLLLGRTDCYSFQSIGISVLPIHCETLFIVHKSMIDCEISPYCLIIYSSSIHTHGYETVW